MLCFGDRVSISEPPLMPSRFQFLYGNAWLPMELPTYLIHVLSWWDYGFQQRSGILLKTLSSQFL